MQEWENMGLECHTILPIGLYYIGGLRCMSHGNFPMKQSRKKPYELINWLTMLHTTFIPKYKMF